MRHAALLLAVACGNSAKEPAPANSRWRAVAAMRDIVQLSGVCGVTSKGKVMCRIGDRAIEVPGITTARRIANPYVELADGSVVEIAYASRRWTVKPKPAWAGITGIETGGYGWSPTCGVKNGHAHCWSAFGSSDDPLGRLGRGDSVTDGATPAPIAGNIDAVAVAAGNHHACALDGSGAVWCWGSDRRGELGVGRVMKRREAQPVARIGPAPVAP